MASPGTPLMRLEDTRGFRLDVRVNESRIGQISPGAIVPITFDSGADGAATISGPVAEIEWARASLLERISTPRDVIAMKKCASLHELGKRIRIASGDRVRAARDPVEEGRVAQQ